MAKGGQGGDPARRRYWREVVERWRRSGQSVRAFCEAEGVKEAAFYWWRQRLNRRRRSQGGVRRRQDSGLSGKRADGSKGAASPDGQEGVRFLPVQITSDQASQPSSGVEIHWANGHSVRLCRHFDRQTLVEVLAVLETRPC